MVLLTLYLQNTDSNHDDRQEDEDDEEQDGQEDQPLDLTMTKRKKQKVSSETSLCLPDSDSSSSGRLDLKSRQLVSFDRNGQYRIKGMPISASSSSLANLPSSSYSIEAEKEDTQTSIQRLIHSVEKSAAQAASIMASVRGRNSFTEPSSTVGSPFQGMSSTLGNNLVDNQGLLSPNDQVFLNQVQQKLLQQHHELQLQQQHQLQLQRNQNNNQRTAMKQKLEDAFRENGFLVKTKQVSDGDATFCKFRQLRKYTRYYLKSWHKHLPDEVNKLYKGFLPPKTPKSGGGHTPSSGRTSSKTPKTTAVPPSE